MGPMELFYNTKATEMYAVGNYEAAKGYERLAMQAALLGE